MIATLWTITIVTANGIDTTVRRVERDAYQVLKDRFAGTFQDAAAFDRHVADGTFGELSQWLLAQCAPSGDRFSVASHTIETAEPSESPELDAAYREAAATEYAKEGRIEIDDDAVVSHGADDGAYVEAWVWVYRDDVPLCACGARNDDGEGFDGMCGSCADRAEAARATEG